MSNFKLIIHNLIRKHLSLIVLAVSSLSFFLSNILLKDLLSDVQYGLYSIIVTYIALLSLFGLFGCDQVLLRTSTIDKKVLVVDYRVICIMLPISLGVSLFSTYIICMYYDLNVSYFSLFLLSFSAILIKLSYQTSRMLSMFTFSQLTLNLWKIGLLFFIFFGVCINTDITLHVIILCLLTFCLLSLASFIPLFARIKLKRLDYPSSYLLKLGSGFFIAMMSVSLLSFLDRFIIEQKFGLEKMGDYFFFVNLYLYPFILVSTYIGFKELVAFKKEFDMFLFKKRLIRIIIFSILSGSIYFIITLVLERIGVYDFRISAHIKLIFALMIFGVIKIISSLLSAAMGARADVKDLKKVNIFTIFLFVVLLISITLCSSMLNIVLLFIFIWVLRYSIYFILLLNQYRD